MVNFSGTYSDIPAWWIRFLAFTVPIPILWIFVWNNETITIRSRVLHSAFRKTPPNPSNLQLVMILMCIYVYLCVNLGPMTTYQLQKWSHYHLYLQCWPPRISRIDQSIYHPNDHLYAPKLLIIPKKTSEEFACIHSHKTIMCIVAQLNDHWSSTHKHTNFDHLFSAHQRKGSAYQSKEPLITAKRDHL